MQASKKFQSTPSARRATCRSHQTLPVDNNFNPRPPRGGRLCKLVRGHVLVFISIHALREEGDCAMKTEHPSQINFSPRPPRGGRLIQFFHAGLTKLFQSTPSARRATLAVVKLAGFIVISIHALREEGDSSMLSAYFATSFISIHALREEGDYCTFRMISPVLNFNPRPPRGGRQQKRRKNPPRLFHYTHLCTI